METRRVVKIGGSYYVALPKDWVLESVGERGVVILEAEEDGSLKLSPLRLSGKGGGVKSIRIACDENLYRNIVSAYLRGFEVIEVSFSGDCREEVLRVIERARQILLGLEIVGEEQDSMVLQCFTRPDYDLYSIVQRINTITLAMLRVVFQAVETGDRALAEKVLAMDDIVDRLYFLAVRVIRSRVSDPLYPSSEKSRLVDIRLVVRNLENIGDLYERLFRGEFRAEKVPHEIYWLLESFQRTVVEVVLGEDARRKEALELYNRLEEVMEKERPNLSPRLVEVFEGVATLLRDILDLT
ncbi:phosphate uptake regulator PhoU [Infirmifilum lucidum]|uniref:Phosphate uptake regulator PhoU n=1 Tax=Infirmifilum lucidum TaxID=2776706 RepID=A0A7L9FG92_9CREN|nr:phosphate uptake regulator PhoU [Infirmifilum lucidum]QOJ78717.1 phosphate uptake regulator PhoU [Infirmifilum lucidum]